MPLKHIYFVRSNSSIERARTKNESDWTKKKLLQKQEKNTYLLSN